MNARSSRNTPRAGWQLIELSFVLGALALISVTATRLIVGLLAIESRCGRDVQEGAILDRLAQQWRADLHRTSAATLSEDSASLHLVLAADVRVDYRISGGTLSREQRDSSRGSLARETYPVAARRWRFDRSSDGRTLKLVRESAPALLLGGAGGSTAPSRVDAIESAIGVLAGGPVREGASP
jgi:hypothetical protein